MVTKKDRRHSGYVTPRATIAPKDLIANGMFVEDFYDDWVDYRDGFRDWFSDFKKIKNANVCAWHHLFGKRKRMNEKQKLLLQRRKARKYHHAQQTCQRVHQMIT